MMGPLAKGLGVSVLDIGIIPILKQNDTYRFYHTCVSFLVNYLIRYTISLCLYLVT